MMRCTPKGHPMPWGALCALGISRRGHLGPQLVTALLAPLRDLRGSDSLDADVRGRTPVDWLGWCAGEF
eukprot:611821-Prymnesium_polylepis.1